MANGNLQLDSSYKEVRRISAGNSLPGDLHEFLFTTEGTALLTIYEPTRADLSSVGGPAGGHIYDSLFQEIDVQSEEVLFQWRASDHYNFTEAFRQVKQEGSESKRWDWFHINSVEKDALGNYLVSARYTHTVTYVDGRTGDIIWTLGGQRNDFIDLSDGMATNFAGQHDARWHETLAPSTFDGSTARRALSLFDNGGDYDLQVSNESRGMAIMLDLEAMTAQLVKEYLNPARVLTYSQGNMQSLPSGNVLLGYGFNGMYTEFSREGEVLCDIHLQPGSGLNTGNVQSYRIFKQSWTGRPMSRPDLGLSGDKAFMSWNGATEVRSWLLQASDDCDDGEANFWNITTSPKTGFETAILLNRSSVPERWIRAVAFDEDIRILGSTAPLDLTAAGQVS